MHNTRKYGENGRRAWGDRMRSLYEPGYGDLEELSQLDGSPLADWTNPTLHVRYELLPQTAKLRSQLLLSQCHVLPIDLQIPAWRKGLPYTLVPAGLEHIDQLVTVFCGQLDLVALLLLESDDDSARDIPLDVNLNMSRFHDCQHSTPLSVESPPRVASMPPICAKDGSGTCYDSIY